MNRKTIISLILISFALLNLASCDEEKEVVLQLKPTSPILTILELGYVSPYNGPGCLKAAGFCGWPCNPVTPFCPEGKLIPDQAIGNVFFDGEILQIDIIEHNLSAEWATIFFEQLIFPVDEDFSLRKSFIQAIFEGHDSMMEQRITIKKGNYEFVREGRSQYVYLDTNDEVITKVVLKFSAS